MARKFEKFKILGSTETEWLAGLSPKDIDPDNPWGAPGWTTQWDITVESLGKLKPLKAGGWEDHIGKQHVRAGGVWHRNVAIHPTGRTLALCPAEVFMPGMKEINPDGEYAFQAWSMVSEHPYLGQCAACGGLQEDCYGTKTKCFCSPALKWVAHRDLRMQSGQPFYTASAHHPDWELSSFLGQTIQTELGDHHLFSWSIRAIAPNIRDWLFGAGVKETLPAPLSLPLWNGFLRVFYPDKQGDFSSVDSMHVNRACAAVTVIKENSYPNWVKAGGAITKILGPKDGNFTSSYLDASSPWWKQPDPKPEPDKYIDSLAATPTPDTSNEYNETDKPVSVSYHGKGGSHGKMKKPPWMKRYEAGEGPKVTVPEGYDVWFKEWDLGPEELVDPSVALAEYYLLEGMLAGAVHPGLKHIPEDFDDPHLIGMKRTIQAEFDKRVGRTAEVFRRYAHCAIGGELRHHQCMGGQWVSTHRRSAWAGWSKLWDQLGLQLLDDAIILFQDFGSGGFGGKAWAACAEALRQFEAGEVSPGYWVDRCANLEHNGGAFMNKIHWPVHNKHEFGFQHVKSIVCPAHARSEPSWGLFVHLTDLEPLYRGYFMVVNQALWLSGQAEHIVSPDMRLLPKERKYLKMWEVTASQTKALRQMADRIFEHRLEELPELLRQKAKVIRSHYPETRKTSPDQIEKIWRPNLWWNIDYGIGLFAPLPEERAYPPDWTDWGLHDKTYQYGDVISWQGKPVRYDLTVKDEDWDTMTEMDWRILSNLAETEGLVWKRWGNRHGSGWRLGAPSKTTLKTVVKPERKEDKTEKSAYFLIDGASYFQQTLDTDTGTKFSTEDKGAMVINMWDQVDLKNLEPTDDMFKAATEKLLQKITKAEQEGSTFT